MQTSSYYSGSLSLSFSVFLSFFLSLHFSGHFPDEAGLAGFIEAKDDGSGGDNWSYVQSSSQIFTTNKPTPNFLQAGSPSCRLTSSVKALKGNYSESFEIIFLSFFNRAT